jgi:hypothetical protein
MPMTTIDTNKAVTAPVMVQGQEWVVATQRTAAAIMSAPAGREWR